MKSRLLLALFAFALTARAQSPTPSPTPEPTRQPLWRCELPGGTYEVALRAVISVSTHDYIVDSAARVTEVNIDTSGNLAVRFYYIEPNTPNSPVGFGQSAINKAQELAKEIAGRTGQDDAWQKVMKTYPGSTHAHTVEYRLDSKEQINKVFESAERAFRLGQNTTLKLP